MEIKKAAGVLGAGSPDAAQLEKINLQAKGTLRAEDVYVFSVRLCDDQVDRDYERFSQEALRKLAPMFIGKTGICDHEWSSEKQVARIFDCETQYEGGVMFLKAWAYILRSERTAGLIGEIEAGIKKEVSVGCAMAKSICSVCGTEYGSCEHRKGESYGGEVCSAVLCEPVDAYEFSFVAVPAQKGAGVLKKSEKQDIPDEWELKTLRKDAALGRRWRKELEDRLVRHCLVLEMGLEEGLLRRMAGGLSADDLAEAEKELGKKSAVLFAPESQLKGIQNYAPESNSAFLI